MITPDEVEAEEKPTATAATTTPIASTSGGNTFKCGKVGGSIFNYQG